MNTNAPIVAVNAKASRAWAFVRTNAWAMIALGAICTLLSLMMAMLAVLLSGVDAADLLMEAPELQAAPSWMISLMINLMPLSLGALALSLITLVSGLALLARQSWSLWLSIAMFWIGAIGNLVGIVVHAILLRDFRIHLAGMPEWIMQMIEANYWPSQISGALFGLVFAVGFGWTAWKLGSAEVRSEFIRRS